MKVWLLETWLYGSVSPILYHHIKENNKGFIIKPSVKGYINKLKQQDKQIIDAVF
ncbi:MAG: hypothetical protein Q8784_01825 [Vigna little leaf phytoplasma]|nr:hypothetical protein [Vigna little leaf phytoplasma]